MPSPRPTLTAHFVGAFTSVLVCAASLGTAASSDEIRIETLRHFARPAEERIVSGAESDALRSRLTELDRALQALAPLKGAPPVQSFRTIPTSAELETYRAWIDRSRPALASWLRVDACNTSASDGGLRAADRIPLRDRIESCWDHGRRIAADPPRLQVLRRAANLLAWRASFDAAKAGKDREPCEIEPAEVLASTITLAYAYDDSSLIGTMARIAIEEQTLRAARLMLEQGTMSASELRRALEPSLARSAAFDPREMIEGELRAFLALYERVAPNRSVVPDNGNDDGNGIAPGGCVPPNERIAPYERIPRGERTAPDVDALSDAVEALDYFSKVGDAFDLAQRPSCDPNDAPRTGDDGFLQSCRNALARVNRHRSIVAVYRVALALLERREREGALPQSLDELAPAFQGELPRDPVTGAPIPYRFEGERVFLGPTICTTHGLAACRHVEWAVAVEQLLAWDLDGN